MNKGIVLQALQSISFYLSSKEKRSAIGNFFLLLIASVLDVFGLASLVPVIMAASNPDVIRTNKYIAEVYGFFGFENYKTFLVVLIIGVFFFFLIKNLFSIWVNYKQVVFTAKLAIKIIRKQFDKYTNLPYWHFNNEGSAKLINGIITVPQWYIAGIIRAIFVLFSEIAIMSVIVIGIFVYQPVLFIILIVVLTPSAVLTYQALKNRSQKLGDQINHLRPISHALLTNTFNGYVELKLANKIEEFRNKFIQNQRDVQALDEKSYLFSMIPLKVIEMVAILGIVTIFLYSILFTDSSSNLITLIGLFAAAAYRLMPSLNRMLTSLVTLKQSSYTITELDRFNEFEKEYHEESVKKPVHFEKNIEFQNVSFSFPGSDKKTIDTINLNIRKGEKVGFIGSSGSGKTTLMNLLLRFYEENSGAILVDNVPLKEENKRSWYDIIGYVKQDTFLMESSIKDNITLADVFVDEEKLNYALEKASLKGFVDSLPEGVNTLIGERGSRLSGGQKQRIGIARALYKNTQVLVLDEATSALDTTTEREVSEAINRLSDTDITILIIAHRITTLKDCDKIFEMGEGKIVAERTYEEVLKEVS
ncbi:ABC transporter ATP-binding protein [Rufibacter tibetensis]|uniref:ABC transporter ATP-binding protein n=1 Tax=Rufibacter tibetensis TaxID=512763 RepID=A0A0P0CQS1_9BACT|nr:ABC transporter ATP-binding protein [Rufibacter tibetensis]ALI99753.1 hypothetical protein DC20_13190 [Rufibacter tibetensis]